MRNWIPTLWLGFVIVRYGSTAMAAMRAPFNPGLDLQWMWAWLGFAAAVAVSVILLKGATAYRLWLGLTIAASLTGLILSHTWLPALIAGTVLTISAGCGEFILERFDIGPSGLLERIALTVPMGLGVLALGQLGLALAGHFNKGTSWGLIALAAIPGFFGVRAIRRCRLEDGIGGKPMVVIPLAWIFLLNLLWAMAPEIQFDPGSVHLAVPRIYLDHGGVVDLPYFFHSYFVHLLDMVFGLCLALGGPLVAKFIVLSLGLAAAAAVFVLGRMLFDAEAGAWAALIFYATPLVIWLSGTTYLDLAESCFIIAALIACIRWFETRSTGWLFASGWIAGVAAGTKLNALTVLGCLPFAIAWYAWKRSKTSVLRALVIYGFALAAVAVPWYAVIYRFTGNPVYPFMNAAFHSSQWEEENTNLDAADFGIGHSPANLLRLPFRLTWDSSRFGTARGGVGFALLLIIPMAFVFFLPRRFLPAIPSSTISLVRVILACIALHLTVWAFSFQYGRYYVPVLPLVCVVGCGIFLSVFPATIRWNRLLLFAGVLAQVPVSSIMFWNIPDRYPLAHALGNETSEDFLRRGLLGYRAVAYLNGVTQPGEKVLGVGFENLRFYLKAPLYTLAESTRGQELRTLAGLEPGPELAAALVHQGFGYILASRIDLPSPAPYYPYLQPEFVERFATEVYRDDYVTALKICGLGCNSPH